MHASATATTNGRTIIPVTDDDGDDDGDDDFDDDATMTTTFVRNQKIGRVDAIDLVQKS